jgi:hypothetical protein
VPLRDKIVCATSSGHQEHSDGIVCATCISSDCGPRVIAASGGCFVVRAQTGLSVPLTDRIVFATWDESLQQLSMGSYGPVTESSAVGRLTLGANGFRLDIGQLRWLTFRWGDERESPFVIGLPRDY